MITLPCGCEVLRACVEHAIDALSGKLRHTPGPWLLDLDNPEEPRVFVPAFHDGVQLGSYEIVNRVGGQVHNGPEFDDYSEHEANALLIAAAPELLSLLVKAKEMAEFGDINADMEDDGIGWKQWYRDTRSALAKVSS